MVSAKKKLETFASGFQALSEPSRLRMMALLADAGQELCVCELVDALEEPQYHVSRSLKILEKGGWVIARREGKWVYFGLPSELDRVQELVIKAISAIPKDLLAQDRRELGRRLKLRDNSKSVIGVQKTYLLSRRTSGDHASAKALK